MKTKSFSTIKNLFPITIIILLLLSFSKNNNPHFEQDYEDIGTIKQSILKPELFKRTQKGVWVLLDGAELGTNTELYKILEEGHDLNLLGTNNALPDALGKFIRSSNYMGKGSDPQADRLPGSVQKDTYEKHQHGFGANFLNNAGTAMWNLYGTRDIDTEWTAKNNNGSGKSSRKLSLTSPEGGNETRPVNISMYTYIKVSK